MWTHFVLFAHITQVISAQVPTLMCPLLFPDQWLRHARVVDDRMRGNAPIPLLGELRIYVCLRTTIIGNGLAAYHARVHALPTVPNCASSGVAIRNAKRNVGNLVLRV
jgi:hypothetical protein